MNQEILITNLKKLITNPEDYYDEGIAKYLLNRLGKEGLEEKLFEASVSNRISVMTNIFGLIEIANKNRFLLGISNYDRREKELIKLQKESEKWNEIISEIYPNFQGTSKYVINYMDMGEGKKYKGDEISINLVIALSSMSEWFELKKSNNKFDLNTEEYNIFISKFYSVNQDRFYSYHLERNKELIDLLCEKTISSFDYMKKSFKKNEEQLINYLFSTDSFKKLINLSTNGELSKLFSEESLYSLFRKSALKENLRNYPNMLSGLLSVSSPENWVNAAFKNRKFNLVNLFNPLITMLAGYSIKDMDMVQEKKMNYFTIDRDKPKSGNSNLINEFVERLKYFKDYIKNKNLDESEVIGFYLFVCKIGNAKILKETMKVLDLPKENEDNEFLFTLLNKNNAFKSNGQLLSFPEIYAEYLKEKLDIELDSKKSIRKLKI